MPLQTCQAVGCSHPVARGRFMCRPHWYGLPAPLRRHINATWRDRQKHAPAGVRAQAPFILAHVEACDEARRWTADAEGRLAHYIPDALRLRRLYEHAGQTPPADAGDDA